jgi:succinate dehydrogenase / fumarate reductase cytochrome b subunit
VLASNPVLALWHTVIGKKGVMAVTGVVLVGFVIAHMLGNLKVFGGSDEINSYSRFLREVGSPELSYGQLLWVVRIVLLVRVILHITAPVQLTRMSWAARPIGYTVKRNIETTFAARVMRWGGVSRKLMQKACARRMEVLMTTAASVAIVIRKFY